MPTPPPPVTTDYWQRQDQHITRTLNGLRDEARRTRPLAHDIATESRRLQAAKASYDAMLADMHSHDRAVVERLMTGEMTMLLLAVSSAAGDLAVANQRQRAQRPASLLESSRR